MEENQKTDISTTVRNTNEIKFDVLKIDSLINEKNEYVDGENKFIYSKEYKKEEEEDKGIDYLKYFSHIKSGSTEYLGNLSKTLKKESHGYNRFENGDEYFGLWNKDKKDGYGIYYFNPTDEEIKEIYVGEFKNNVKSGDGLYFSIQTFEKNSKGETVPQNFSLAIGNFSEDIFTSGKIYSMFGGKKKIYKGDVNNEGKKNDDNGEIYEDGNKVFHGKVVDNMMNSGRIIILKDDASGSKETSYFFERQGGSGVIEGDINYDYSRGDEEDETFIQNLRTMNTTFNNEIIQNLYVVIMKYHSECKDFDKMNDLNFEKYKQELKKIYGKMFYC